MVSNSNFDLDKMYCGAIRRGDIFLYEDDKQNNKEFPVLVLQEDVLNQGLPTVVCSKIETYKKGQKIFSNEVLITKDESGLGRDGIIKLYKIFTIDRRVMIAKKAELSDKKIKEVYQALDINLGRFRD